MQENKSVIILAGLKIKPEFRKEFVIRSKEIVELTRQEEGCTRYDLVCDAFEPEKFYFIEEYKDDNAFQKHRVMPYMNPFRQFREKVVDEYFGVSTLERIAHR